VFSSHKKWTLFPKRLIIAQPHVKGLTDLPKKITLLPEGRSGGISLVGKNLRSAKEPERIIEEAVLRFVRESPGNRRKLDGLNYWDDPLLGFARGDDPLFYQYKQIIGEFHATPQEMFDLTFGKIDGSVVLSVISWVLPASEDIRRSNREEKKYPSLLWAHARHFVEQFNVNLREHVVSLLTEEGFRAMAPMNSPHWKQGKFPEVGLASNWSERHIAFACGLGAFGLCDGLITARGKAVRLGSVVTDLPLRPSKRTYPDHHANCLYHAGKTCMACAQRCPAGAITEKGHDKEKCFEYAYRTIASKKEEYGVSIAGCGLCQTKVPCEFEIPRGIGKKERSG
jgi:epoxyqueuosine reductase